MEEKSHTPGALPSQFCDNPHMHAYLLICPDASERTVALIGMAKAMMCNCNTDTPHTPCGKCSDCIKLDAHTHPDFFSVGDNNTKVSVDDIRKISSEAYLSTNEAKCKVFALYDVDKYNPESQNALLKILEEPPSHVKFIACASTPFGVLPTVRSRLYTVYGSVSDYSVLYAQIKRTHENASDTLIKRMSAFVLKYEGCDTENMDEKLFGDAFDLALDYFKGERNDAILYFPRAKEKRDAIIVYLQVFLLALHEIMQTRLSDVPSVSAFDREDLYACASKMSSKRACALYEALEKALINASSTLNLNTNSVMAELSGIL